MKIITGKVGESLHIGSNTQVTILGVEGSSARMQIDCHDSNTPNREAQGEALTSEQQAWSSAPIISGDWLGS